METPDDRAGYLTEVIMRRIKTQCEGHKTPQLQDGQYNRVYEAVYEVLFRELVLGRPAPTPQTGEGK